MSLPSSEVQAIRVQAILFDMDLELFTDAELAKARELQAWMDASIKSSEPYALGNVSAYQIKQRDAIEAKLNAGESTQGMTMESRETISRTFLAHLHAGESARLRKAASEILPFCKPILERFWTALEEYMRNIEQADRLQCSAFSLAYKPSLLWQACYTVASTYKPESRLRAGSYTTPKHVLAGLIEL